MAKLAVFDLDGTLLDTLGDLAAAGNYALEKNGFPVHEVDAYKGFVGSGVLNLIRRALPARYRQDELLLRLHADFLEYYHAHAQDKTKPYDGIPETLHYLRANGVKLAVLSNKPDAFVQILVEKYFPGLLDLAFGQREGVPLKPDPTALREIMKTLQVPAEDCIYIGDSGLDMEMANYAGVPCIGVLWGFRTKQELINHGATVTIDKVEQLKDKIIDKEPAHSLY